MSGINIVFYSRACPTCKNLLNILMNEGLLKFFKLYCVDDKLDTVPPYIHTVPTMIVANINKPLVVQEAFEWIQKVKFIKQDASKKILQSGIVNIMNKQQKDPIGYTSLEMGGISDPFAYRDVDMPLVHNYQGIKEDKSSIFTAPEQEKLSDQEQAKRIKNLEKIRDDQNTEYSNIMKEQQLKAVLSAEKETKNHK